MSSVITWAKNWYAKYERPISSVSLIGGFLFDIFTLRRIDALWDNLWTAGHLVIVGVCIILVNRYSPQEGDAENADKIHFWLVNILQFFFGGLLSTFLVFYFRSASIIAAWPFLLILALAFIANESLKRHYARLWFQIVLFYLSLFCFTIYFVPVIFHQIGTTVFVVSGLASLVLMQLFLMALQKFGRGNIWNSRWVIGSSVVGIFVLLNVMYFTNIMPPIPLSLKDGGPYYWIGRDASGNYTAAYEDLGWKKYFSLYDTFNIEANQPVFVYSAVFAPTKVNLTIVHDWQHYNQVSKQWENVYKVTLPVVGGREEGYRTYSILRNTDVGKWRVQVETTSGQVIGTIRFNVVRPTGVVNFKTETK